ncbi:mCG1035364 [Mus musculus]|nr:mCG1035364 [Mus musculus]
MAREAWYRQPGSEPGVELMPANSMLNSL